MKTFDEHLKREMQNAEFAQGFEDEVRFLKLALRIVEERNEQGLTQKELAQKAHITQQQLSKIENGVNCNMFTFLKVCQVLGMQLSMKRQKSF